MFSPLTHKNKGMSSPRRSPRRQTRLQYAEKSSPEPRGWRQWLSELWPSQKKLDEKVVNTLQDYTRQCQEYVSRNYVYKPQGDIRNIQKERWEPGHCIQRYSSRAKPKERVDLPEWEAFEPSVLEHAKASDEVARHLAQIAAARTRTRAAVRPARSADFDPSEAPLDATLGPALLSSPAAGQRLLYNYFRGVGSAAGKDLQHDWRDAMGIDNDSLPPSTCGSGSLKMKLHQATVFSQMRIWAAAQGSGASFQPEASPKGFLALHSTGSGKTCLASAVYQAFWAQTLPSKEPRPLMLFTTPANRDRLKGSAGGKATDTVLYYNCAKQMFPNSAIAKMSAADFDKRVRPYSFTQAGNRLRAGSASKDAATFRRQIQNAVIVIDEAQSIFAPEPQFAAQAAILRDWLLHADSDGATVVIMTATPGRTVPELFVLLNCLRRKREGTLNPQDFEAEDGTIADSRAAEFRRAMAGRVSYVDYRNNTNDYPVMRTSVQSTDMSEAQRGEWMKKVDKAKDASLETAVQWGEKEGKSMRKESNMAKSHFSCLGFDKKGNASAVYASGDLSKLQMYSSKLVRLIENIETEPLKKQYVYSAFKEGGVKQIALALQGRGWTNMYSSMRVIGGALDAYVSAKSVAALNKLDALLKDLPGESGKRFLTTADWGSAPPKSPARVAKSPRRSPLRAGARKASPKPREDEEDPPASEEERDRRAKAESQTQTLAMQVFNCLENTRGSIVNLLLATDKYNEGLDLKSVRIMHMFEPQTSLAAERQMEGRGRRYCSHTDLPPAERDVEVLHYFSELGHGDTQALVNEINELQAQARRQEAIAEAIVTKIRLGRSEMRGLVDGSEGLRAGFLGSALNGWLDKRPKMAELPRVTDDDVRLARLSEAHAQSRVQALQERGAVVPVQLHIEAANAKDKREFLEGLRGHSKPLASALARLQKRAVAARSTEDQRRSAQEVRAKLQQLEQEEDEAIAEGEAAKSAARQFSEEAKAKIESLKRIDPALLQLLGEDAVADVVTDTGIMATDVLVHGVARREGAPLLSFMQALADSATDCMVLEALHARMGVNVNCQI